MDFDNRPFNLHPIFSFEKMSAFATLKKNRVEFNLIFFRVPAQKKIWVVTTLYFFKFMP